MDTTIGERFTQIISVKGLTVNAFANSLGKPYSSIKVILDGTSKPGFEVLERVLTVYEDISRDWLLMGEGEMIRSSNKIDSVIQQDDYLRDHVTNLEESFRRLSERFDSELSAKNQQIAGLHRMLESVLGKSEGVTIPQLSDEEIAFETMFRQYRQLALGNQPYVILPKHQFSAARR